MSSRMCSRRFPSEVIRGSAEAVAKGISIRDPRSVAVPGRPWELVWYVSALDCYQRLKPFIDRHGRWLTLDWAEVERLHGWFLKHGPSIVFIARFMPSRAQWVTAAGMVK